MARTSGSVYTTLHRFMFPTALLGTFALLITIGYLLSPLTALKGSYTIIGLGIGAVLYNRILTEPSTNTNTTTMNRYQSLTIKGIGVIVVFSFVYSFLSNTRLLVLLAGLPIAYALLCIQYAYGQSPRVLVPQIATVFVLSPVTKYLTTTFYWGRSDLFLRTNEIDGLLSTGSLSGIPGRYEFFPNLHILSADTKLILGLPPDDGILIAGIVTYTGAVFVVYAIANEITNHTQLSLGVTIAFSFLTPIQYYTTYFFPQSLAIAYFIYLFLAIAKLTDANERRFTIVSLLFIAAFVFSHHLSLILVAPIVGGIVLISRVNGTDLVRWRRFGLYFSILGVTALVHWSYYGRAWWFYVQIVRAIQILSAAFGGILSAGGAADTVFAFGRTVPAETPLSILLYPPYIHLVFLLAFFSIGVVIAIERGNEYVQLASVLVPGIVGALFLFDTPVSLPGLNRFRLAWAFPFAFPLGVGIFSALKRASDPRSKRLVVASLVILSVTGPMAAADDLGYFSLNPQTQHAYDAAEYQQMQAGANFYTEHGQDITMLWASARTYRRFGIDSARRAGVTQSGISTTSGLFLYRKQWSNHQVRNILRRNNGRTASIYMSDNYIDGLISSEHNVYAAGQIEMTYHETNTTLGSRSGQ